MQATDNLKESLLEAIDAFSDWKPGYPEPTVRSEGIRLPISRLCTALVSCTDVMPDDACQFLGLEAGATYDRGVATFQKKIEEAQQFNIARPTGFKAGLVISWRDCDARAEASDLHRLLSAVATMRFVELGQYR